jgi:3-keto-5-aminohexanoate cleavage enzyme
MTTVIQTVLNEDVSKRDCSTVPVTPADVGRDLDAALKAGSSLLHFHARGPNGEQTPDDEEFYVAALGASNISRDVLWYPPQGFGTNAAHRWRHLSGLRKSVGLDFITIDPTSFDFMVVDESSGEIVTPRFSQMESAPVEGGLPVQSPLEQWVWFCQEAQRLHLKPLFGILEPGSLRRVLTWVRLGLVTQPVLLNFFLTERFHFGLEAEVDSLETYMNLVPSDIRYEWFCCPMGVSSATETRLFSYAVTHGGHLRVGVGSPPLEGVPVGITNADIVEKAVELVIANGGVVATPGEARSTFGVSLPESVVH